MKQPTKPIFDVPTMTNVYERTQNQPDLSDVDTQTLASWAQLTHTYVHPVIVRADAITLARRYQQSGRAVHLIHQVNCQNVFGAGFARVIAEQFPDVKRAYHAYASQRTPAELHGSTQRVDTGSTAASHELKQKTMMIPSAYPSITVWNSFTQLHYGRPFRYVSEKDASGQHVRVKKPAVYTDMDALVRNIVYVTNHVLGTYQNECQSAPEKCIGKHAIKPPIVIIPYGIGCGLAGGDWNTLYRALTQSGVRVLIARLDAHA